MSGFRKCPAYKEDQLYITSRGTRPTDVKLRFVYILCGQGVALPHPHCEHRIFLDNFLAFPEAHLITGKRIKVPVLRT